MKQLEDRKTADLLSPGLFGFTPDWNAAFRPTLFALPAGIVNPGDGFRERERIKRKAQRWLLRMAALPSEEREFIRQALDTLDTAGTEIVKAGDVATATTVAVLFARADSVYKTLADADVWDIERNALSWPGGAPIVAHPPCRAWGNLSYFAKPAPGEKELGLWAVDQVRQYGGVLEHPKGSKLFTAANMPRPGQDHDQFGGWTLEISQFWFGHKAEKKTWLYIVGCDEPPPMPLKAGRATHVIASGCRNDDGSRVVKGDAAWRPEVSLAEREHTPAQLAQWLVSLARLCRPTSKGDA